MSFTRKFNRKSLSTFLICLSIAWLVATILILFQAMLVGFVSEGVISFATVSFPLSLFGVATGWSLLHGNETERREKEQQRREYFRKKAAERAVRDEERERREEGQNSSKKNSFESFLGMCLALVVLGGFIWLLYIGFGFAKSVIDGTYNKWIFIDTNEPERMDGTYDTDYSCMMALKAEENTGMANHICGKDCTYNNSIGRFHCKRYCSSIKCIDAVY